MGGFLYWLSRREQASELQVFEVVDIAPDLGDIKARRTRFGYAATFEYNDTDFRVMLNPHKWIDPDFAKNPDDNKLPMVLRGMSIAFDGDGSWSASGNFGMQAFAAYSKILLAIKKCLESAERDDANSTEFLKFSGFEDKMNLLYDRFFRKHLADRYTRVDNYNYVRNDVLQRIHDATGGASKEIVDKSQKFAQGWLKSINADLKKNKEEAWA